MKRTLAITAATAMLALSLAGCGAERNGDMDLLPDFDGANGTGATATDTMRNDNSLNGTGTTNGATANTDTATGGLGSVTGAVNRGTTNDATRYGSARYGATGSGYAQNGAAYGVGGPNSSVYTATNNGGLTSDTRYKLMLENGRVHDTDGYLLDGENASYRTF